MPIQGFASVLRNQFLIPNKWDKQYTISLCIGAVMNAIVNYLLIPRMQARGAAIGTIAAEMSVCISQIIFVRKNLPIKKYILNALPFAGIGAIMLVFLKWFETVISPSIGSLIMQIIIGGAIYLVLCFMYSSLAKNELYNIVKRGIKH